MLGRRRHLALEIGDKRPTLHGLTMLGRRRHLALEIGDKRPTLHGLTMLEGKKRNERKGFG